MVSLNTVLTLGVIGAAIAAFYGLGGASGIGSRIGSGLSSFGQAFQSSLIPTITTPETPSNLDLKSLEEQGIAQGTRLDQLNETTKQEFGGTITSEQVRQNAAQTAPIPNEKPIAAAFQPAVSAGAITRKFAETYSFNPPTSKGVADVSKIFQSINKTPSTPSRAASNYGGYGSAINQNTALAQAIQASASKYGEYFG